MIIIFEVSCKWIPVIQNVLESKEEEEVNRDILQREILLEK